jgi:organic radical activating enzyme
MKYRINEIFYSIQGEGRWTGTPAIFIRFSGCNLNCEWCDTKHETYKEYTVWDVLDEINEYPSDRIILTGGEPTLQLDINFLEVFKYEFYKIHLETNGTNQIAHLRCMLDWITVSPKEKWQCRLGNELKLVYRPPMYLGHYEVANFKYYYLQPCSMQNIDECIKLVKENPKWMLSIQTQKLLNIR